ncbi:MAG: secretin N-terminal domain-containing protein [Planctomycetota bacterium]|jgi:type IV pilus assembly protein PilQ
MCKKVKNFSIKCVLAFLIISLFICPFSNAEGQRVLTEAQKRLQTKITYQCRELPIDTVLMQLAELANIDIVKSPKVTGDVTVKITNATLEESLNNILAVHGFSYIPTENMIRVVLLSEVTGIPEKLLTRIYQITYANIGDVAAALQNFISKQGEIATNKGTSHIIVTDIESKINAIDNFIEEIDHITPQVLVEVRIYDITSTEGFELGADWDAGRNVPEITTKNDNTLTRTDNRTSATDTFETTITDTVDTVDPANTGIVTETVTTIAPETTGFTVQETDKAVKESTTKRRKPFVGGSFDRDTGGTLNFSILNDAVDLDIALNILHSQVEAKLLANPRVLVLDNETANFKIIREIPYTEQSETSQGGSLTSTQFKEVGVQLKVTPHIARDGMLRLHIVPEFGVVVELNDEGAPTIDTRLADTIALIKDGQTVILGGLRKRESTKDLQKVPILGDIPLLGGLFRDESETVVTNELVVFITPKIVEEPSLTKNEKKILESTEVVVTEKLESKL